MQPVSVVEVFSQLVFTKKLAKLDIIEKVYSNGSQKSLFVFVILEIT